MELFFLILLFAVVLFILILIHEFGHFITAKWAGIRVDEFGIGFPPRIWGIQRGETLFSINALPVGGFVKIFGENPDETSLYGPDKERSFVHKPRLVQALVLVAGIVSHVLLAWFLLFIALTFGMTLPVTAEYEPYVQGDKQLLVTEVLSNSPAERAGLRASDTVTEVSSGGEVLEEPSPDTVPPFVEKHSDDLIDVTYRRGEETTTVSVRAEDILVGDERHAVIGVVLTSTAVVKLPILRAAPEALELTVNLFVATTLAIVSLIGGILMFAPDLSQIAGPVGIVSLVGDAAAEGFAPFLTFVAILSINLAIINLVPFPSLDGGRLLFVGIEALKGSPIKPSIANAVNAIGLGLIVLLIFAVTYKDILRIIQS